MKKTRFVSVIALLALISSAFISCSQEEEKEESWKDPSKYKEYFIGGDSVLGTFNNWDTGTTASTKSDGSVVYTPGTGWGSYRITAAFYGIEEGYIASFDNIIVVSDSSDFNGSGYGENEGKVSIGDDSVYLRDYLVDEKDGIQTFCLPLKKFHSLESQDTVAFCYAGYGSVRIYKAYLGAKKDPHEMAVTEIKLNTNKAYSVESGTMSFSVEDSSFNDVTSLVTFSIESEEGITGSSFSGNRLTTGTISESDSTSGKIKIKATYTNADGTFEDYANITVYKVSALKNLATTTTASTNVHTGWSWDAATVDVTKTGSSFSLDMPETVTQWQSTLKIATNAGISAGDTYLYTVKVLSSTDQSGVTVKFTESDNAYNLLDSVDLKAGEETTLVYCSQAQYTDSNIIFVFDFGGNAASSLTISDIVFAKVD